MKNGRFWNSLTTDTRLTFLVGLTDGWTLRGMTKDIVPVQEMLAWQGGPQATLADLEKMITSVYADAENQPPPTGWVTMACFAVQRGDTTRDAVFMALRKHLASFSSRTDSVPVTELDPIKVISALRTH